MHGGDIYRNPVELDFSVNTNPLGMPERVRRALCGAVDRCANYPDIRAEELRRAIGGMTGMPMEEILCGNGASELFPAIVRAASPETILIPVPSFYGYERAAAGRRVEYYRLRPENGFALEEDFLDALKDAELLFLGNPNNPAGNCIKPALLEQILCSCREKRITVILDECFIEFTEDGGERSFLQRLRSFPNLVIVRAFTKIFAIPGVRLGYLACADERMRGKIRKQLPEWNLSVFAQAAGAAAACEREYRKKTAKLVKKEREYLTAQLRALGITVYPGDANFLLLHTAFPLKEILLERGILIRDCRSFRGLSEGYYRIAVKRRTENDRLLAGIRDGRRWMITGE